MCLPVPLIQHSHCRSYSVGPSSKPAKHRKSFFCRFRLSKDVAVVNHHGVGCEDEFRGPKLSRGLGFPFCEEDRNILHTGGSYA